MFKVFSLLAALTTLSAVLASPQPALATRTLLNDSKHGSRSSPNEIPSREHAPGLTNAQRLARGLPLKPPSRRSSARRAMSSASASSASRGYIQVWSVDDNGSPTGVLGYVSKTTKAHMQYRVDSSLDHALLVSSGGEHNLVTLNSDITSPTFLGLVQDPESTSSGLAKRSSNSLYLASTEQTSPNATPQNVGSSVNTRPGRSLPAESAVWTVDPNTNKLSAQWINPDASAAPTIAFIHDTNVLFTGDLDAYRQAHHSAQVQRIEFVFVST
ncbi:hypothetical protein C8F04DRAFT_31576 [Mycena alexandri]|uniref:Uncharacterized protein n=1 Tax=Mycena alexandri TaxID=1745969 RepID=A0AAD6XAX4_9AGAR|nr:hypothetical protein C8F04DRAFT_31576 [Mycena alexandri]